MILIFYYKFKYANDIMTDIVSTQYLNI